MYVSRRRSLLFWRRSLLFWRRSLLFRRRSLLFWRRSLLFQGATRFYSGDTDFNNITVITPSTILNTAALMYVCLPDPLLGICTCMCPGAARYYFGAARYYSGAARYYSGAARYYSREPLASILRTLISTTSYSHHPMHNTEYSCSHVCLPHSHLGICTCMCPGAARYYSGAARYYSGAARYYGSRRCRLLKSRLRRTCSSPSASALSLPCKNGT